MYRETEYQMPFGGCVALICLALFIFFSLVGPSMCSYTDRIDQESRRMEAEHLKFEIRCKQIKGKMVYNGKGSPSELCFRPDGRLFETWG
jgi:hypothetical protein